MNRDDPLTEDRYDLLRLRQWNEGETGGGTPVSRRDVLRLSAGLAVAAVPLGGQRVAAPAGPAPAGPATLAGRAAPAPPDAGAGPVVPEAGLPAGPIVKPLPPELFTVHGTNAEMRWEAMREQGYRVPVDRFFVRNHTRTPLIEADEWRLRIFGPGLSGRPTAQTPVEVSYRHLRRLPATTLTAFVECAGNGRSFFDTQQSQPAAGTPWRLGAVGVATWRGVRLAHVLRHAGLTADAVDVMPYGLDPNWVTGGVDLGPVRRPLPVGKALHDVLLAYEMNGEPLPADHGSPVRVIVPSWTGISSIKWVGAIEVSDTPLFSPWNTQFYRLFGPDYPAEGAPVARQVLKSAFELAWDAQVPAGRAVLLHGRSWSGSGRIRRVDVSTDGGRSWRRARRTGPGTGTAWQRWQFSWRPPGSGRYELMARATDVTGATQPDAVPSNTMGYLFGAVVRHPVTAV